MQQLRFISSLLLFFLPSVMMAQDDALDTMFYEDIIIKPPSYDKSPESFIEYMKKDATFYKAFKNLRLLSHVNTTEIKGVYKQKSIDYHSVTEQTVTGNCRTMRFISEQYHPDFFKGKGEDKEYRWYTASLYDRLFYTRQPECESVNDNNIFQETPNQSTMDKHISEMKKFLFAPGSKAEIPLIGKKTAIFDKPMNKYYDFTVSDTIINGLKAYSFVSRLKPEFSDKRTKTVIKEVSTYFHASTRQVLGRDYQLSHIKRGIFDFDVLIHVELGYSNGKYYPSFLTYDGNWNIPTKKREICSFSSKIQLQ